MPILYLGIHEHIQFMLHEGIDRIFGHKTIIKAKIILIIIVIKNWNNSQFLALSRNYYYLELPKDICRLFYVSGELPAVTKPLSK